MFITIACKYKKKIVTNYKKYSLLGIWVSEWRVGAADCPLVESKEYISFNS